MSELGYVHRTRLWEYSYRKVIYYAPLYIISPIVFPTMQWDIEWCRGRQKWGAMAHGLMQRGTELIMEGEITHMDVVIAKLYAGVQVE